MFIFLRIDEYFEQNICVAYKQMLHLHLHRHTLKNIFQKCFSTQIETHTYDALVIGAGGADYATMGLIIKGTLSHASQNYFQHAHTVPQGGINAALGILQKMIGNGIFMTQ